MNKTELIAAVAEKAVKAFTDVVFNYDFSR